MKSNLIIIFLIINIGTQAQSARFDWAKMLTGSSDSGFPYSIKIDSLKDIYIAGLFWDSIDFDPGPAEHYIDAGDDADVFLLKLDSQANFIWAISLPTGQNTEPILELDALGCVYLTGRINDTIDIDPGLGIHYLYPSDDTNTSNSILSEDGFLIKLEPSGNFVWGFVIGGNYYDNPEALTIHGSDIYFACNFGSDSVDCDPGPGTFFVHHYNSSDFFFAKYDTSSAFKWAKSISGNDFQLIYNIAISPLAQHLYIIGGFRGSTDFDPGPLTYNLSSASGTFEDLFISKFDSSGNLKWAIPIGGVGIDYVQDLAIDEEENVVICGMFEGIVDFDPSPSNYYQTSSSNSSMFILKIDSASNFIWATQTNAYVTHICLDNLNNVITTGSFSGIADFDPDTSVYFLTADTTVNGSRDIFISILDSNGNFDWAGALRGISYNTLGTGLAIGEGNSIYSIGYFSHKVDFDPDTSIYNLNTYDVYTYKPYILKLYRDCNSYNLISATACDEYLSPSGNYIWSSSGTYNDTLVNSGGCDSVLIVNLTIINNDATIIQHFDTLIAVMGNINYQWLNCDSSFTVINGSNNQMFIPALSGNYAVELTNNGCIDTSDCYSVFLANSGNTYVKPEFSIIPNPAANYFRIKSNHQFSEINIEDSQGRTCQSMKSNESMVYDLTSYNLKDGLYFIKVVCKDFTTKQKLLILNK